jgi:hypothetical protein
MMGSGKRVALLGLGALGLAAGLVAAVSSAGHAVGRQALKSNNLTGIRQEALTMFPRGTRLQDAALHLEDIGFSCEPMLRSLADISGPALMCASNGRGYPDFPAINVTLSTRNGLVSEIEVWNIMARADDDGAVAEREPEDDSEPVALADPPEAALRVASATLPATR